MREVERLTMTDDSSCAPADTTLAQRLAEQFEAFLGTPFPLGDDRLYEAHADLADYDGVIAGLVSRIAEAKRLPMAQLQLLMRNDDLEWAFRTAAKSEDESLRTAANNHLAYLDLLHSMVDVARRAAHLDGE
jgi:hypothetical protein